jgi:ATP-binding cassette, subfamily B, bacterial
MTAAFLWQLVRPWRQGLAVLMLILLAESLAALALPWFAGQLGGWFLQSAAGQGPVWPLVAAVLGLLVLRAGLSAGAALLYAANAEAILAALRLRLFEHLLALPMPWHQGQERGSLLALATLEIERLGHFITGTLVYLAPLLLTAGGATVALFLLDPALALLVPVLVPCFYILARLVGRRLRGLGQQIQSEHAAATTRVEEMLDLLPALKSFAVEPAERARHAAGIERLRGLSLREARLHALIDPAMGLAVSMAAVVLLVAVGSKLQAGEMGAAETISFLMYVALLVRPVSQLATVYGQVQTVRGTLARLQAVLETAPEAPAAGTLPPRARGQVTFDAVTFAYPERGAALRGLSLSIAAGETVALTGANGAGKSTAIALLMGFQRPDAGRILLDGQDITTMPPDHLRRRIGLVPQTRHLRNASVRDNIAFGRPVTEAEVLAAARIAQAHDFILGLPQGYDTLIGDRGLRLSGGQQQRIALARALVGDPPVLILDEATSMYDPEGEAALVAECRGALAGRTVIIVTHRPASLALADRVLRLDGGRIVGGA